MTTESRPEKISWLTNLRLEASWAIIGAVIGFAEIVVKVFRIENKIGPFIGERAEQE